MNAKQLLNIFWKYTKKEFFFRFDANEIYRL